MFGVTAFAQSPFASLGGAFHEAAVAELEALASTAGVSQGFPVSVNSAGVVLTSSTYAITDYTELCYEITPIVSAQTAVEDFLLFSADLITLTSGTTAVQNFPVVQLGNIQAISVSQDVIAAFVGAQTDSQTLTTVQVGGIQYVVSILEVATLAEGNVSQYTFLGTCTDDLVLTTLESVLAQFNVPCTELITLSDYQFGRGWFKIDDNQAITWVAVVDAQASGWSPVDDSQTVIWTAVVDAQASGWSLVDDTQDPNWVNVNDIQ